VIISSYLYIDREVGRRSRCQPDITESERGLQLCRLEVRHD
jgi:hypothetical protein